MTNDSTDVEPVRKRKNRVGGILLTVAGLALIAGGSGYTVYQGTHPTLSAPPAGIVKQEIREPSAKPSKPVTSTVDTSIDSRPDPVVPDDKTAGDTAGGAGAADAADVGPQPSGAGTQQTSAKPMAQATVFNTDRIMSMKPNRLYIPCLGVYAITQPHGQKLSASGRKTLILNSDPEILTWWKEGGAPGSSKGAVLMSGHVDMNGVWGALHDLGSISRGCSAFVSGPDGTIEQFVVTQTDNYIKRDLPSWTNVESHKLVVVTCGGQFDVSTGHYEYNVVTLFNPVKVWRKGTA